jgi:hypothetical protein
MKKLTMLGIISGGALLTVAPFSLQWSQEVSLLLNSANARIGPPLTATCIAGVHRRVYRRTHRRAAYAAAAAGVAGYGYGSYYGYSSPYYSIYYAPQPYSVISYTPTNPPSRYSYYLPPFATVSSYDYPPSRYSYYRPPYAGFYGWR